MKKLHPSLKLPRKPNGKKFEDMSTRLLAFLGGGSFLVAGYYSLVLHDVVPKMVKATNQTGLIPVAIGTWILVGLIGCQAWYFGSVAKRTNEVLYKRVFQ